MEKRVNNMEDLKKETAKEIIEYLEEKLKDIENNRDFRIYSVGNLIEFVEQHLNMLKKKYDLKPKYPTLREYINEHSSGAYHRFNFSIGGVLGANVIDCEEFERYFNSALLDKYVVVDDKQSDNGGDCENYECNHYLVIKEIEE
jgi:hypothetical protein